MAAASQGNVQGKEGREETWRMRLEEKCHEKGAFEMTDLLVEDSVQLQQASGTSPPFLHKPPLGYQHPWEINVHLSPRRGLSKVWEEGKRQWFSNSRGELEPLQVLVGGGWKVATPSPGAVIYLPFATPGSGGYGEPCRNLCRTLQCCNTEKKKQ